MTHSQTPPPRANRVNLRTIFGAGALIAAAMTLSACGPSVSYLVEKKHYREAICAAQDGSNSNKEFVRKALANDSEIYFHAYVLGEDELKPILGDSTAEVMSRAHFVQINIQGNTLPIERTFASVGFKRGLTTNVASNISWDSLAWVTKETLPPKHTRSTYATGDNILKGIGVFLSAGLLLPFVSFKEGAYEVDAPIEEYKAKAPKATALYQSLPSRGCVATSLGSPNGVDASSGLDCSSIYVLQRQPGSNWSAIVSLAYLTARLKGDVDDGSGRGQTKRCMLERTSEIPLGEDSQLGSITRQKFKADVMRPIREVEIPLKQP